MDALNEWRNISLSDCVCSTTVPNTAGSPTPSSIPGVVRGISCMTTTVTRGQAARHGTALSVNLALPFIALSYKLLIAHWWTEDISPLTRLRCTRVRHKRKKTFIPSLKHKNGHRQTLLLESPRTWHTRSSPMRQTHRMCALRIVSRSMQYMWSSIVVEHTGQSCDQVTMQTAC